MHGTAGLAAVKQGGVNRLTVPEPLIVAPTESFGYSGLLACRALAFLRFGFLPLPLVVESFRLRARPSQPS